MIAIALVLYFATIMFIYTKTGEDNLIFCTKIISLIILSAGIILFEIAYHKDSGNIAINGVEVLMLALYTLSISHMKNKIGIDFNLYILYSTCIFVIYYILKTSLVCSNEKRKFANSLSDIHEIVTKNPIKKPATKKKNH